MPEETANTTGIPVRTTPELADAWDHVAKTAADLVLDLLTVHRDEILTCWRDTGESSYGLTAGITFKGAANAPLVKIKLAWTTKYSDEASEQVKDPAEPDLPFPEETADEAAEARARAKTRRGPLQIDNGTPALPCPPETIIEGEIVEETSSPDVVDKEDNRTFTVEAATAFVRKEGKASEASLQRHFRVGYTKASSMLEELQRLNVVGRIDDTIGSPKWEVITEPETAATEA